MTQDRNSLAEVISDMETDVTKATAFAAFIMTADREDESGYVLELVADALQETVERIKKDWEKAFELSRPSKVAA